MGTSRRDPLRTELFILTSAVNMIFAAAAISAKFFLTVCLLFTGSGDIVRDARSLSEVGEHRRTEAETSPDVPFDSAQGTPHVHATTTENSL